MNLSDFSIDTLKELISGDSALTPYNSGPDLVKLFNRHGFRDVYKFQEGGLPERMSRNAYVVERVTQMNESKELVELIEDVVDSQHYAAQDDLSNDDAAEAVNEIIVHDGYKLEKIDGIWKIIGADLPDEVKVKVHFKEIQKSILDQIEIAKYTIWVAFAWFTDETLFKALIKKKKQGLNIQIVVMDDEINRKYGFDYEEQFETYRVKPRGRFQNIMHNKFCIIDLKTVIHGSYNWTNKARYNDETVSIDSGREIAETYANQFLKLKN